MEEPSPTARPDRQIDLDAACWQAQPDWLANPASRAATFHSEGGQAGFRVDEVGRGMKWSWTFAAPVDLTSHGYLVMRYRAEGLSAYPDYAFCVLGEAGQGYDELVRGKDLHACRRWRTAVVPLKRDRRSVPRALGIAFQVQAASSPAVLEVADLRLTDHPPAERWEDYLAFDGRVDFDGFAPVDVDSLRHTSSGEMLDRLRLSPWPEGLSAVVEGIPFRLPQTEPRLAATGLRAEGRLTIPINQRTGQVFLLLLAAFEGADEPVYGGGPLHRITQVDRFNVQLTYSHGPVETCFPANLSTDGFEVTVGPQVLCVFADPSRVLQSITLCDAVENADFAVAAVTCRTRETPLRTELDESAPPPMVKRWQTAPDPGRAEYADDDPRDVRLENKLIRAELDLEMQPRLRRLLDKVAGRPLWTEGAARALASLIVDGAEVVPDRYHRTRSPEPSSPSDAPRAVYEVAACPGLRLTMSMDLTAGGDLRFRGELANEGPASYVVGLTYPQIGPYVLGDALSDNEYVYPCRGAVVGSEHASLDERYGGRFGVQFMATVHPAAGQGLHLRTEDTTCIQRHYLLHKDADGMYMGIRYPPRTLAPGQIRPLADAILMVGDGDWHRALNDYRRWLRTWYRPASPRQAWFREVFNFRQRFLHCLDPLYDARAGRIDVAGALAEAREQFGGVEYLHLFDWGTCGPHGRIYGRIGDYSPYDFIAGGQANLRGAIARAQERGVPTGLYIEGYLLNEKGRLGRAHGPDWQLRRPDGSGARWPSSAEIYVCAGVSAWREVQSATYAAKATELAIDGMYIDQFGFTDTSKDCYSPDHGHPVPSDPVHTELATTRAIRDALDAARPGVAIYTEESPCDVTSQYQDGSFTYAMNQSRLRGTGVPINLFRFAVPDFKTFEILVCDQPTGSWAQGVRWTFFNGGGLWLEGPADKWFKPGTLATIRNCHAILRRHRNAFTSDAPEPLVPTLAGGILANAFPISGKELWTLYNTRHRTYRGEVLRVPHREGWVWEDAWHRRAADVRQDGTTDVVSTCIDPDDVGCLFRQRAPSNDR